jgi:hypothetical protein
VLGQELTSPEGRKIPSNDQQKMMNLALLQALDAGKVNLDQ